MDLTVIWKLGDDIEERRPRFASFINPDTLLQRPESRPEDNQGLSLLVDGSDVTGGDRIFPGPTEYYAEDSVGPGERENISRFMHPRKLDGLRSAWLTETKNSKPATWEKVLRAND